MKKRHFLVGSLALVSWAATNALTQAQFVEAGDAGETLTTASYTGATSGVALTTITGTLGTDDDVDLYEIRLNMPSAFSATTNNPVTNLATGPDTELSLYDASGHAIEENDDDASGLVLTSTLPSGNAFTANLSAGIYYLGISASGDEAENLYSQLLFASNAGDTTALVGPASGLNPTTLNGFDHQEYSGAAGTLGAYEIDLTGALSVGPAAVPEPSTGALLALGLGGVWLLRRRSLRS
jgi:hypothetical protein